MGVVFRYILRQTAVMMLSITLALTLAIWLSQSLRYLTLIVSHSLPLSLSFKFLSLLLPSLLLLILPAAMFIAVAFVYQKLILDRELVVLRACGVSQLALARPALALAGGVTIVCYALSLYFIPLSVRASKDLEHDFLTRYGRFLVQEGVFTPVGPGLTIYVRKREGGGGLRGVLIEDARNPRHPVSYTAAFGQLNATERGMRLTMRDGTYQERDPSTGKLSILNFDDAAIDVDTGRQAAGERNRLPEELFLGELLRPGEALLRSIPGGTLLAVAHTNLALPLYALGFTLIGLAFVLNGGTQRQEGIWRIGAAILLVSSLEILAVSLRNVAGRVPVLLPLMYVGPLLPTVLGLAVMAHADGRLRLLPPPARPHLLQQPQPG